MRALRVSLWAVVGSLLGLSAGAAEAQPCPKPATGFVAYVGRIEESRGLLAWGRTDGHQAIGYDSSAHGKAEV